MSSTWETWLAQQEIRELTSIPVKAKVATLTMMTASSRPPARGFVEVIHVRSAMQKNARRSDC
jgi:hypothetical protein